MGMKDIDSQIAKEIGELKQPSSSLIVNEILGLNIDINNRVIFLATLNVDWELLQQLFKSIFALDRLCPQGDNPIKLVMFNYGGDVYMGMAIADMIRAAINPIYIYVFGSSMSMGALLLQTAKKRFVSVNSRIMIHAGKLGLEANHPEIQARWMEQFKRDEEVTDQLLIKGIKAKHGKNAVEKVKQLLLETNSAKITNAKLEGIKTIEEAVRELIQFDTILNARQTIDIGLADEIITSMKQIIQ